MAGGLELEEETRRELNGDPRKEDAAPLPVIAPKRSRLTYRANLLGNIESSLKALQGYGIMALELIQNADDAGAKSLSFDARDDALVVGNDGEFTSCGLNDMECPWVKAGDPSGSKRPCNFHAIAEMGSRSKVLAADQTGRFGIGFVSVYQITDTPIIQSSGIEMCLNPLTGDVLERPIELSAGTRFVLPWASEKSEIRAGLNGSPTPADVADKVVTEVAQVLEGSLLFLRHVERVELRRNGRLVVEVEIARSTEEVILQFQPSGAIQHWLILSREADDLVTSARLMDRFEALARLDRSKTVSVAVPLNVEQVDGLLYAYLPTRQSISMPIHVNADFFPHASRQAIVLEGEQHERYWNEVLIDTGAAVLADNFVRLRDLLGSTRFWALLEAAFQRKDDSAFKVFWDRLAKEASKEPSVWTTKGDWCLPKDVALPSATMTTLEQAAIADLGPALIHQDLRRHWNVVASIGGQLLKLSTVVAALQAKGHSVAAGGPEVMKDLWSGIEQLIKESSDRQGFDRFALPATLEKLKSIPFLLDVDDRPVSANEGIRLPSSVSVAELRKTIGKRRVIHSHVLRFPQLSGFVAEYLLDDLASDLAAAITDHSTASAVIGDSEADARRFYALMTSFPTDRGTGSVSKTLAHVPMLRTGTGFVSPLRGQLPGDFRDPIGHFQIVESRLFGDGMKELARDVLEVRVLTFRRYVEDHLEDILNGELTREQYRSLLSEILNHRFQLEEDGTLEALADIAFVRNRAGEFVRPREAYFWSAPLEAVLGDVTSRWVDDGWLPGENARAHDLFERLGMPFTVAAEHIVERIIDIAEGQGGIEAIVAGTTPIVRHILDRWTSFGEEDRAVLAGLRDVAFLAALLDGKRDDKLRYRPEQVYRAARASGFASQVPVVEMTALRQSTSVVNDFLDLIGMPSAPPTDDIVSHLEHCMACGLAVSDLTYQMLTERLEAEDAGCIDRLQGTPFIHFTDVGFLSADEVFWLTPPFGRYWYAASSNMRQRDKLYARLGVVDSPEPRHFATLAVRIAGTQMTDADVVIHGQCMAELAEAIERDDPGAAEAADFLADKKVLLNLEGHPIWTDDAVWLDSEHLAASFGSELDDRLVRPADVGRAAITRFMSRLDVPALTDVARFRLAEEPDGEVAIDATAMLQERADLVLWLPPNRETRQALGEILQGLEIRFSNQVLVQAEIDMFDPPVRSPVSSVPAYLNREEGVLHLRSGSGSVEWAAAFRTLFAEVERYCPSTDIRPLRMTATQVMSMADRTAAEQALLAADFHPTANDDLQIESGRELEDTPVPDDVELPGGADEVPDTGLEEAQEDRLADAGETPAPEEGVETRPDVGEAEGASEALEDQDYGAEAEGDDEAYASASARSPFGADTPSSKAPGERHATAGSGAASVAGSQNAGAASEGRSADNRRQEAARQVRRSRMLSYVSRSGSRGEGDAGTTSADEDITDQIDAAAMKAALDYEESQGRLAERQPHFNPGFDIVSKSPSGDRRLIEVKGLENEWTERGVKLSHVQFSTARDYPSEFWLYIVEHARDPDRQRVTAIGNPFTKVEEYWFDHNWREMSEEQASSRDILLKVGLRVEHQIWKTGTIVQVDRRGAIPFVVVDFGSLEGRRGLPFNSSLKILD